MDNQRIRRIMAHINSSPGNPTCHDFAAAMGFADPSEEHSPLYDNLDEMTKLVVTYFLLQRVRTRLPNQLQQDMIFSKFSALYLPALVNKFIEAPPLPTGIPEETVQEFKLNNCYLEFLSAISHTPYFSKYLRSRQPAAEPGKELMKIVAQRLVDNAPTWDDKMLNPPLDREQGYYEACTGTALQLISTLLAAFIKEPKESPIGISAETEAALMPWLKKWERRHSKEFLGTVCNRTRQLLDQQKDIVKHAQVVRRALKNWNECGKPGCESSSDLKACGRCQTVRYCCPDHQKAHWNSPGEPHKSFCFKADF